MRVGHSCTAIQVAYDPADIIVALRSNPDTIVLGGGSNVLITRDLDRHVLIIDHKGIELIHEDSRSVQIKVAAGEVWHDVVLWCLERDYGGLENLSLIPGKCGAAPIQNIGAYGVEISDVLQQVHFIDRDSLELKVLSAAECQLGYRSSIFKHELRDKVVITHIIMKLAKPNHHLLRLSYGAIRQKLDGLEADALTIQAVSKAVISIRQSKLPDPEILPNLGSFFKNPIIPKTDFEHLIRLHPLMPSYAVDDDYVKIPAGWLIDHCGLRGHRVGDVGTHVNQALVIVNYGTQDGSEIWAFSQEIQRRVYECYNIRIVPEINVIN